MHLHTLALLTCTLASQISWTHHTEVAVIDTPGTSIVWTHHTAPEPAKPTPLAVRDAAPTPLAEVVRVLGLLPEPKIAFVDFGCGYDARWCVAAAEKWKCKCVGIEINHERAEAAKRRVMHLGLDHLITIIEGDAATVPVIGDVAVAYLYADLLKRMKPRIEYFKAFASYMHPIPVPTVKTGDTYLYRKGARAQVQATQASWGGQTYSGPVCNSPNCAMCNSIRQQLATRTVMDVEQVAGGRYDYVKKCNGIRCWYEKVWVPN